MPIWSPAMIFGSATSGYVVENSIYLDGSADYLTFTPFTAGNRRTHTISYWVKRNVFDGVGHTVIGAGSSASGDDGEFIHKFDNNSPVEAINLQTGATTLRRTSGVFRDPTGWFNVVISNNTTIADGSANNRHRVWVNGSEASFGTTANVTQNQQLAFMNNVVHEIGRYPRLTGQYGEMYLAEFIVLDGTAVTDATSFGEYDDNGVWIPKDPSELPFGTNGFHLKFDEAGLLGKSSNSTTNPTVSFLGSQVFTSAARTFTTSAGSSFGDAASNRSIVIAAGGARSDAGTRTATCTINSGSGDVACTEIVRSFEGKQNCLYFFIVELASGTSGTISVTFSGGNNNMDVAGIAWWRVLDAGQPISISTANADGWSSINTTNIGQNGDTTLYGLFDSGSATGFNWSDATERADHPNMTSATSPSTFYGFTAADYAYSSGESHTETVSTASGTGNETSYAAITLSNNNTFTTNSLAAANQVTDTCTDDAETIGNFATLSPIDQVQGASVLSNGNLTIVGTGSNHSSTRSTLQTDGSGKFAWEVTVTTHDTNTVIGLMKSSDRTSGGDNIGATTNSGWALVNDPGGTTNARSRFAGSDMVTDLGFQLTNGDVFHFELNNSTGDVFAWRKPSGGSFATVNSGNTITAGAGKTALAGTPVLFAQHTFQAAATNSQTYNFGAASFAQTPSSGYKAANTANLAAPTITDPDDGYVQVLDTGANIQSALATARSGYSTYMEVFKDLDSTTIWQVRFSDDTSNGLDFESTAAKTTFAAPSGSNNFLGWAFNMNATHGMFTAEVSHDTGSDTNTAHSLGAGLKMAVVKITNTTGGWYWSHPGMTSGYNIEWNQHTTGEQNSTVYAGIDDTNVIVKSAAPSGTYRVIAIVEVAGFSSLATMVGNGDPNGPFVNMGMQPEFMMCRRHTGGTNTFAYVRQGRNPENTMLEFDDPGGTSVNTGADKDWCASGFKQRTDSNDFNQDTVRNFFWSIGRPFGGSGVAQAKAR